jgi:tetratricopeptide (TPR) repeat protein
MPDQAERIYTRLADAAKKAGEKEAKIGNTTEADAYRKKWQDYAAQAGGAQGGDLIAKLMKEKNWDGAIQAAETVLAEDPNRKSARFNLARCYDAKGQYVEAATEYTKYIELDPDNEKAHAYLVIALSEAGRCAEAMSRAQQAVTRFTPKGLQALGGIYYGFGKALECGKDYASAREKFRLSAGSGDEVYSSYARRQMERMDQMIQRDAALKKQAGQGGS